MCCGQLNDEGKLGSSAGALLLVAMSSGFVGIKVVLWELTGNGQQREVCSC